MSSLSHNFRRRLSGKKRRIQINRHAVTPTFWSHIFRRMTLVIGGIIDQRLQWPELGDSTFNRILQCRHISDIDLLKPRAPASFQFQSLAEAFRSRRIQVNKSHFRILQGKGFYHSGPNSGGTASNKYTASRETGVICTFAHWTTSYIDKKIIIFASWR